MKSEINLLLLISFLFHSCQSSDIRGFTEKSPDQNTYLVVELDKGGGRIDSVFVDDAFLDVKIGQKVKIAPGTHTISAGKNDPIISFSIPPATIFHFDYWGP